MRLRFLLPISLIALGALLAPACSSDDSSDSAATSSNERDNSDSGDSGSDNSDSTDPGSGSVDLGDIPDAIPGAGNLNDCLSQATTYSSLYLEALGGESGAKDAQAKAEQLKELLPDELSDDIDVIADAISEVADQGLLNGSEAFDSPEYAAADKALTAYFQKECGGG